MAFYKCEPSGGTQVKYGTFDTSGSGVQNYTVEIGFTPKFLAIYFNGSSGSSSTAANGSCRIIYDESISTTKQFRGYKTSGSTTGCDMMDINSSGDTRLSSITSSGFVFRTGSSSVFHGVYYYFAIG